MIQAHVVTSENKHLYAHEFDQFLRWRHDIFVNQKDGGQKALMAGKPMSSTRMLQRTSWELRTATWLHRPG